MHDPQVLPADLPVPVGDGAADHMPGMAIPRLELPTTDGRGIDLAEAAASRLVLYLYPRTGQPGEEPPPGWDRIPGARGCTPEACGFRDAYDRIRACGARLIGLSSQTVAEQLELVQRLELRHPLASDPLFAFADAMRLPTFEVAGRRLYKRLTIVARGGRVEHVFYPVFPPDRHPAEVAAWLERHA